MLKETIELLLKGEFICPITAPRAYKDLKDDETLNKINAILDNLGRYIATTSNGDVYYAAWKNIGDDERRSISREFEQLREQLRPIVDFVLFVMDTNMRDNPLMPGDKISESEIISKVEINDFLNERVNRILQIINKRKTTDPVPVQIKALFDYMRKQSIIKETIEGSRQFILTGKIQYIYEVLEFIDNNEHILEEEMQNNQITVVQGDLFSGN